MTEIDAPCELCARDEPCEECQEMAETESTAQNNEGEPCHECGAIWGHYGDCGEYKRVAAEIEHRAYVENVAARCRGIPEPDVNLQTLAGASPKSGSDIRRELLRDVEACVCRDRQNTYGDAEDNFADIAKIASVVLAPKLSKHLTAEDVALFSACIKLARLKTSPDHLDNWIDLAGYAVCGGGIVKRKAGTTP